MRFGEDDASFQQKFTPCKISMCVFVPYENGFSHVRE